MRRRTLLSTLATASLGGIAGCVIGGSGDGSDADGGAADESDDGIGSGPCGDVAIESARASVDYRCDLGSSTHAEVGGSAPGCDGSLTVDLLEGDDVVERRTVAAAATWTAPFEIDAPIDPGEATFRVRGPDEAVVAERTVAVEHYRDAPRLSVWNPGLDAETVTVGEPVTASFQVGNVGGAGAFTARLLADGGPVASREASVHGATDCDRASGPELALSYAFETSGEYRLVVELEAREGEAQTATWRAGMVTVEESTG